jgi:carbon monoxide dehydrogenase subunit G
MIELRKTLIVERPVADVYAYLSDPHNIANYVGPVLRIHRMTTERLEVGTRLSVEASFLGIKVNQRAECTHHEPPHRFETRSVGGRFYFEAGFTLYPDEQGTRIEGWGNASSPTLFRVAEPLLRMVIERQVDGDFKRLKRELEAPV